MAEQRIRISSAQAKKLLDGETLRVRLKPDAQILRIELAPEAKVAANLFRFFPFGPKVGHG